MMFMSASEVLVLLEQYKYFVIFPIVIFEGPIITVISGFLIYLGILNPYLTYLLLIVGDLVGDSLYYSIGRFWRSSNWFKKISSLFGYSEKSEEFLENHFKKHKFKTLFLAKFSHGMGGTIQISSGIAKVDFSDFLLINFIGVIPKTLILLIIGFYVGNSYVKINEYLNSIALTVITVFLLVFLYFILRKYRKVDIVKID